MNITDTERVASLPTSNPLRFFVYKMAEAVTISFEEFLAGVEDPDAESFAAARAMALAELDAALDTYRIVAGYSDLIKVAYAALDWVNRLGEHAPVPFGGEAELAGLLSAALALSEKSLVIDDPEGESKPTPEDAPL